MRHFRYTPPIVNGNPVIKFLFEEMYKQQVCHTDMALRAGFHRDTIRNWRIRNTPRVNDLEAALNYLGYTLKPVKMRSKSDEG
jgi:hypothetical protein